MNASRMTIPVVTPDYYSTPYDQTEEYERGDNSDTGAIQTYLLR